jgi:hypothetical protein
MDTDGRSYFNKSSVGTRTRLKLKCLFPVYGLNLTKQSILTGLFIYLFIYDLFSVCVSSSDCIASSDGMVSE